MKRYNIFILLISFLLITNANPIQGKKNIRSSFEEYIKRYKALAIQHQAKYKIPASITLAQGLLESAAGDSYLAREGNNHFGIKCKETWNGGRIYHDDDAKDECFRKYKSVEDSYLDHSLFLSQRRYYISLFDLDIYDYKGWAHGLKRCGYATDKAYGHKLIRIIETYELYKYDKLQDVEKMHMKDDIYEIKIGKVPEYNRFEPAESKWRRRIYENNDIHYIVCREGDTYDMIAYDLQASTKRLAKYNETVKERKLKKGDIIYLQSKKKYADKANEIHVVEEKESLYSISQKYGMKLKTLYKLNRLDDHYKPNPGDRLKLRR